MKKISIIAKKDNKSEAAKMKIKQELLAKGFLYDEKAPELVITIGGDGTLLYAVHQYLDLLDLVSFVALHTGTLGFFTDYTEEEIDICIEDIIKNDVYEVFESRLLKASFNDKEVYAMNEFRIENIMRTQTLDIFVDGEFFETFKGNGICLSTQAGSSAYNRSLHGGVVDSGLSLMQLTEIAGIHNHKHRSLGVPYILKEDRVIRFSCKDFSKAFLCFDHKQIEIDHIESIQCELSKKKVKFLRYRKYSYLERVRNLY